MKWRIAVGAGLLVQGPATHLRTFHAEHFTCARPAAGLIANRLQVRLPSLIQKRLGQAAKPVLAGGVALLLLLLQAVAVSPDLHHWLHDDAGGGSHDCAAALLQKGFAAGVPELSTAPAPPSAGKVGLAIRTLPPSVRVWIRPPERAPPLA